MKNVAAAIEFGTSKIICVIGREKSIGRFEVLGSGVARYEGLKSGSWVRADNLEETAAKALYLAEKKAKKRVKEVYVGIPGVFSRVTSRSGSAYSESGCVTEKDIESFIASADDAIGDTRYTVVSGTPVYFQLDDGERYIDALGIRTSEIRGKVSFITANRQFIADMTEVFDKVGVKIKAFIPELLAESMFLVPDEERDASAVLLNIGFYDTNVTVVYGDAVVYNRTINAGGMHITNDLSLVMNIDLDMAEQIKKQYSFGLENSGTKLYDYARPKQGRVERFSHSLVSEIIEARIEHLCGLIAQAFENSPIPIARRTRVYLSGGGIAMMKGARDILEQMLKRQVRIARVDAPQLSTPNYYTALSLLDFVFGSGYFEEGLKDKSVLKKLSDRMY